MSQILDKIEDSKWYSKDPYHFRKLNLNIDRIETLKEIDDYSINTQIEIITDSKIEYNAFIRFFKVYYSISWTHRKYFDIDRKTNKHEFYSENTLFNFASLQVQFTKENKSKIKAKIKRILEKQIKEDMIFYGPGYQLNIKPQYDFSERSNQLESQLREIK